MDAQIIFNLAASALLIGVGWWCREIWDSVKSLRLDIKQIEINLPTHYVRKSEIESRLDKIDQTLERIFDKLDDKADKL
jgi:hypothetical protein